MLPFIYFSGEFSAAVARTLIEAQATPERLAIFQDRARHRGCEDMAADIACSMLAGYDSCSEPLNTMAVIVVPAFLADALDVALKDMFSAERCTVLIRPAADEWVMASVGYTEVWPGPRSPTYSP